jgi:hypothetical protein
MKMSLSFLEFSSNIPHFFDHNILLFFPILVSPSCSEGGGVGGAVGKCGSISGITLGKG